jgi:hypothetical protein
VAFTETAERVELAEREPLQPDEPPAAAEDWTAKIARAVLYFLVAVAPLLVLGNARAQLLGMGENFFTGPKFGTIDPVSGTFTQVGNGTFANGYYAMAFDPLTNSFYTTNASIDSGGFASQIKQINATTGAITILQINDTPTSSILVGGLGFDTESSVPEPSTWVMMILGFAGLGHMGFRQSLNSRARLGKIR